MYIYIYKYVKGDDDEDDDDFAAKVVDVGDVDSNEVTLNIDQ
jgi:hypothetical protein